MRSVAFLAEISEIEESLDHVGAARTEACQRVKDHKIALAQARSDVRTAQAAVKEWKANLTELHSVESMFRESGEELFRDLTVKTESLEIVVRAFRDAEWLAHANGDHMLAEQYGHFGNQWEEELHAINTWRSLLTHVWSVFGELLNEARVELRMARQSLKSAKGAVASAETALRRSSQLYQAVCSRHEALCQEYNQRLQSSEAKACITTVAFKPHLASTG